MGLDRQADVRHAGEMGGMSGDGEADRAGADETARGLDTRDTTARLAQTGDFAVLDDVDARFGGTARITPGDGIVSNRAAARLHEGAKHREASAVERDGWDQLLERRPVELHAVGACEPHIVGTTDHVVALTVVVPGVDDAALAHHGVEVQFLFESFPQPEREVVEPDVLRTVVGRADDGRVASDITETDRALLEHGDIGDAEVVGEVVGGGETVTAPADDDDLILLARFRLAPRRAPAAVSRQRFPQQPQSRIASARAVPLRSGAWDIAG